MAVPEGRSRIAPDRLGRGQGQFLDDVKLPGMCHAAFVRSPHAHARIARIATDAALRLDGAIAVLTPEDLLPHVNPVRPGEPAVSSFSRGYNRYPLPRENATFSGEPIAEVVAANRYIAEDMLDAVQVDYDPLPAVLSVAQSLAVDAAVPSAVADALRPLGVDVTSLPLSPQRLWEQIKSGALPAPLTRRRWDYPARPRRPLT